MVNLEDRALLTASEDSMIKYKKKAEDLVQELSIKLNRDEGCYIHQTVYEMLLQVKEEFIRRREHGRT